MTLPCPLCGDGPYSDEDVFMEHMEEEHPDRWSEMGEIASDYPLDGI